MIHSPDCRFIPYRELFADEPEALEQFDSDFLDTAGVMDCAKDCPRLEAAKRRGLELAERFGWP